jgi:predicted nucleotidyltransferase
MADEYDQFTEAVGAVKQVAARCGIPILLVGAYARDLLLEEWGADASMRRTRDVDFGVKIGDWNAFRFLRDSLIATGQFTEAGSNPHKVRYRGMVDVDLVPFGDIAREDGLLACWPDDFGKEMYVLGFQDALECAGICPVAPVPMVSMPAFVGLKILAWEDEREGQDKDAADLAFILKSLPKIGKVLDAVVEWPDDDWSDVDRRCHRWLGAQLGSVFGSRSSSRLSRVLARECDGLGQLRLVRQMRSSFPDAENARTALEGLRTGLTAVKGGGAASQDN